MRKTSAATTNVTHVNDLNAPPRRTTSGRAVRQNTTRPTNYYARPFGSFSAANVANNADNDIQDATPQGFFPALTYFTDAITALPKEVMRQFTLMKEVEAKIHGPNERLGEIVDDLMEYPVPPRKSQQNGAGVSGQRLLSLTANNSVTGSTTASLVNGVAPNAIQLSAQDSVSGSVNGEDMTQIESEEDQIKRQKYQELRSTTLKLLVNLDEKNVVLAEAKRILDQQQMRIDSVMPLVDNEISEEARLGSMTHWAYSDNRQKKHTTGATMNRRDMAATNSLVAAASAIHESDIAQARRDATRETAREKHKGRSKEHVDSDFDDRPKKTHAKLAKSKSVGQSASQGLGISANGEPVKKRKVDKGLGAPTMDRSMSVATKVAKGAKEIPRSTPTGEHGKKPKTKPAPLPAKRKNAASSHASPRLASSPMQGSCNALSIEPPGSGRPQSARLRQNSTATNLRHERLANEEGSRPNSASGKVNGEKNNGKRKAPADEADELDHAKKTTEKADSLKREDIDTERPNASPSGSGSGKAGRGSATATPRQENFPEGSGPGMLRTRSTRSMRGGNHDESSSEPATQGGGGKVQHKRDMSNSHLVRQLAPFNRSPDLDRVRQDDMDEDLEGFAERREIRAEGEEPREFEEMSPPKRRPSSRRNTNAQMAASSPPRSDVVEDEDTAMVDVEEPEEIEPEPELEVPDLEPAADIEDEDEDSEPGDPDDPNEPKYCYCNRGSYGEMIACDNEQCPREWFHLGCTGLREPPDEEEKWYCKECAPLFRKGKGRGRK